VIIALLAMASIGLSGRKRYGVKLLFVVNGLIFVLSVIGPFVVVSERQPLGPRDIVSLFWMPTWVLVSYEYFMKRWQELS
jgi:hypothetical protein